MPLASASAESSATTAPALRPASWAQCLLAEHAGKRASERLWLLYTPVWGSVCGVVMLGGFAERWGDLPLLLLGLGIAVPALLLPLFARAPDEHASPWYDRAGAKLALSVLAFSCLLNYTQTPFFFDVLHAHYGFQSTLNIRNNPVFLYLMTVAYFSTYAVLLMMAYRLSQHLLVGRGRVVRVLGAALAAVIVAGLETVLNANPATRHLYCFDEPGFALWFGSFAYGLSFMCILPVWIGIDERPGVKLRWWQVLAFVLAAVYADSLALDFLRYHVAPHFTTVEHGAVGLGDVAGSCLAAP